MWTKAILIWAAILIIVFLPPGHCRLSEKQLAAAVKLVRNMCLGKSKANPEDIDKMHQGNWNVAYEAQCYMWCGFNMYKMLDKENHFDKNSAMQQLDQLPIDLQDYVVKSMVECEHAVTNFEDKCYVAFEYSKCLYFYDPEKYFLP